MSDLHRFFSRASWVLFLFILALLYALGVSIADYLGATVDVGMYWLGQGWVLSLFLATFLLDRYYDPQSNVENLGRQLFGLLPYGSALVLGAAISLTLTASLTVLLIRSGLNPPTITILVAGVVGAFLYAIPPIRLANAGFGELTLSILIANLVPALAFLLQLGEFHRLIAMATFPLTFLLLASFLILRFPHYTDHLKYRKNSLIVRMGWDTAMTAHNIFLLGAFLLVGLAAVFGFPSFAATPLLLALPLALLQVWYVTRIAGGDKPNWNALSLSAVILVGFTSYLMTFAFWTH
ncbi:MAG: UbiA family prenyltransferase [Anaerolineales bacterium]|jgi:1,4-dihydroxy-2-naphthoate octaprenyltransferase|nr:UbiA family prenyltransferase [Anaerolineales bacterium]